MKYSELVAQQSAPATPVKFSQLIGMNAAQPAPASTTDDMSTWDRLLAGIGQGMHSGAQGLEQLMANNPALAGALNPQAGAAYANNPQIAQSVNAQVNESAKLDQPLMQTAPGQVGSVLGNMALTAPAGMGTAGAVKNAGGWLAKTGLAALSGAEAGAAAGAVQPVENAGQAGLGDLITGNAPVDFNSEKLKQLLTGAGFGAATGGLMNRAGALAERVIPSNAAATLLNAVGKKANASDFAKEGEALAAKTGVSLTPAQVSGGKAANMAENAARQSVFSRDLAFEGDRKRIAQLADHFDRTLEGITKSNAAPATAGAQVQGATKKIIGDLENIRRKHAEQDFGKIRAMTKGQAAIQPESTNGLLQTILKENEGVGAPGADALANFARKNLANVDPKATEQAAELAAKIGDFPISKQLTDAAKMTSPAQGNLDKLMQLRAYASKVAGGQAKISGENQDRRIGAMLLKSIDEDIEKASETIGGDLGAALKEANGKYRAFSQQIESVKASPLGRILGEDFAGAMESGGFNKIAPEVVIEKVSKLKPTELGVVRGIMEKSDPESWAVLKRSLLEDALDKAKQMPASEGANTAVLRPNMLIKNVGDAKRLEAVFTPRELSEINAGLDVARRLSDKTGFNFSGTAGQQEILGLMNSLKSMTVTGAANAGGAVLGSRSIARLMTNADGRRALLEISRPLASAKRARELTAKIAAILGAQEGNAPNESGYQ